MKKHLLNFLNFQKPEIEFITNLLYCKNHKNDKFIEKLYLKLLKLLSK